MTEEVLYGFSAAVIGLQKASACIGSTFMPMVFGLIQQAVGIGIMPLYLTVFAVLNIGMLELAYRRIGRKKTAIRWQSHKKVSGKYETEHSYLPENCFFSLGDSGRRLFRARPFHSLIIRA